MDLNIPEGPCARLTDHEVKLIAEKLDELLAAGMTPHGAYETLAQWFAGTTP